jgi:HAD superfamily hydrolase (TIGR01509 family)
MFKIMQNRFSFDNPDAIILDMDGVIIDTKEMVELFWIEKFKEHNLTVPEENFEERFHGRPARLVIDEEFSVLSENKRDAMEQEIKLYDSSVDQFTLIPGIEEFMRKCRVAGFPLALVTSAMPPKVEVMKGSLSINPEFSTVVTADRITHGKPNSDCYWLALRELGVSPERAIVFEDSVSGVQAAAGTGVTVIGVNEQHMEASLKQSGATAVIRNFLSATIDSNSSSIHFTAA